MIGVWKYVFMAIMYVSEGMGIALFIKYLFDRDLVWAIGSVLSVIVSVGFHIIFFLSVLYESIMQKLESVG